MYLRFILFLKKLIFRFSEGEASYFYDILSPFIEKTFANEAYEDFKNFGGGKGEKAPVNLLISRDLRTVLKIMMCLNPLTLN